MPDLRPDPADVAAAPLFQGLGPDALRDAVALARPRRLPAGAALFRQGDPAGHLHLLLHGRLKVAQEAPDGAPSLLRFVGPMQPAGVLALLGPGQLYPATVSAAEDCVLLSWEGAALAARHPAVVANALRAMAGRAQEAHQRLHEMAAERVEQRLAQALLRLLNQAGVKEADGAIRIGFPLSRQDLATMAGTTLPTASRILGRWEEAGVLAPAGRFQWRVRDAHALVLIAQG